MMDADRGDSVVSSYTQAEEPREILTSSFSVSGGPHAVKGLCICAVLTKAPLQAASGAGRPPCRKTFCFSREELVAQRRTGWHKDWEKRRTDGTLTRGINDKINCEEEFTARVGETKALG